MLAAYQSNSGVLPTVVTPVAIVIRTALGDGDLIPRPICRRRALS